VTSLKSIGQIKSSESESTQVCRDIDHSPIIPATGPQHQRQSGVKYRTEASTIIKKGNKEEIGLEVWTKKSVSIKNKTFDI
jgi:hypothetical protein